MTWLWKPVIAIRPVTVIAGRPQDGLAPYQEKGPPK